MSLKKVEQVKSERGFRIWDLLVYGIVAVLIVALFLSVFLTRDKSPLTAVGIYVNNQKVFVYDFEKGGYEILTKDGGITVESGAKSLTVKINNDYGYNEIVIEKAGKVYATAADCGGKDCTHMRPITDKSGIIYCSPHRLRIVPDDYKPDDDGIIIIG